MTRRTLTLLRHGKSAWGTAAIADHERPLKARGVRDAGTMGTWLAAHQGVPERLLSSTATRARETARLVAEAMGFDPQRMVLEASIYEANVDTLLRVVAEHGEGCNALMLVGHNPGLEALTSFLTAAPVAPGPNGKRFPTATLAILEFEGTWPALGRGDASLKRILRPRELPD